MRMVTGLLVTLSILVTAPATAAQALNGEWFRVTLSADGTGFDPETELASKGKLKPIVRYARFVLNEGVGDGPTYTLTGYAPTESGDWEQFGGGGLFMIDAAESFAFSGVFFTTTTPLPDQEGGPNLVEFQFNATVKLKVKNDEVKSAQVKSQGLLAFFSNDSFFLSGKGKITMKRVPVAKLPFVPGGMIVASTEPVMPSRADVVPAAPTAK